MNSNLLWSYDLSAERYRAHLVDSNGALVFDNGAPIFSPAMIRAPVSIDPCTTAIVIVDPWLDLPVEAIQIMEDRIVPLVRLASSAGHLVIILTNDPKTTPYYAHCYPGLTQMVDGNRVNLFYHQQYGNDPCATSQAFCKWLKNHNIDTLIYAGFASNACVIGRPMGMVMMYHQGLNLYFVPEASMACELPETMKNQALHYATSIYISHFSKGLLHWEDLMKAMQR